MTFTDPFEEGANPNCDRCGTIMRNADGGYLCGGCGHFVDTPWVERPTAGDDLRGILG